MCHRRILKTCLWEMRKCLDSWVILKDIVKLSRVLMSYQSIRRYHFMDCPIWITIHTQMPSSKMSK
jgi:hypothetical protein